MRTLFVSLLFLTTLSARAAELLPGTLVLPPRTGPAQFQSIDEIVSGGDTFLLLARGSFPREYPSVTGPSPEPPLYAVVVSADGRQLAPPALLPVRSATAHWIGQYLLLTDGSMRVDANGTLLDRVPRPLANGAADHRAAAGDRVLLVRPWSAEFLHADGTTTPITNLPEGTIRGGATNGRDYAIYYTRSLRWMVRMFNARGETVRDAELYDADGALRSDGRTWSVVNREKTHQLLYDEELNLVKSLRIDQPGYTYEPITGRGYYRLYRPGISLPGAPPAAFTLTEALAGSYRLMDWTFPTDTLLRGDAQHLYLAARATPSSFARLHLLSTAAELNALPEPLDLRGPVDREHASLAENASGMKLLVWNEAATRDRVDIHAARLSKSGAMLDAEPLRIGIGCRETRSAVATDGSDFVVVWGSCGEGGASLVTASGQVVPSFTRPAALTTDLEASAVFDGESYIVAWSDQNQTYLQRIARDGSPLQRASFSGGGAKLAPRKGGGVLLVYGGRNRSMLYSHLLRADLEDDGPNVMLGSGRANSLTRVGDRFLLQGRTTMMWLTSTGAHATTAQPSSAPVVDEKAHVSCEADGCTLLWKTSTTSGGVQTLASTIGTAADGTVSIGEPAVVAKHGAGLWWGEVVHFRGTPHAPKFLLERAADADNGGLQFFAHDAPVKRRLVRR